MVAKEKKHKNVSFYGVCMYVRPKLTFVSFFLCFFFAPSPKAVCHSRKKTFFSGKIRKITLKIRKNTR